MDDIFQCFNAVAVQASRWHYGNSEDAREFESVDMDAGAIRLIHHVQDQHGFETGLDELKR